MDIETLKKVRVLLVDDDEDDYIIIKKIFDQIQDSPFKLDWTPSYEKAITLIESAKHDLYLIDYRLGEHTGLELLQITKPAKRPEPFILLTGAGDRDVEWRSMKLAAADYLVKGSFNAELLSRTLYYALQRKLIEQHRLKQLVELNRSKDEFISIASHQLRTPATGVKQYIGMLLEGFVGELDDKQRQLLAKAYESNERQIRIVSDLLKVAQVDAGKVRLVKQPESLNDLINDVIREQQSTFHARNQTITYHNLEPDISVPIDRSAIRMVLENIIDNASKYSEDHTNVIVTVEDRPKRVSINICDEGVGIAASDKTKLFEKFSRINNNLSTKVGGTGLGLYWAKKIVDLHGGKITCQAGQAVGTVFSVQLPKESKL